MGVFFIAVLLLICFVHFYSGIRSLSTSNLERKLFFFFSFPFLLNKMLKIKMTEDVRKVMEYGGIWCFSFVRLT